MKLSIQRLRRLPLQNKLKVFAKMEERVLAKFCGMLPMCYKYLDTIYMIKLDMYFPDFRKKYHKKISL